MKCQINILFSLLWLVSQTFGEPPPARPLVFKSWPPRSQPFRSNPGMLLQLRGAGSTKIVSRLPAPNYFYKSPNPMQFAIPSRMINRPLKAAPSTHIYFKSPPNSQLNKKPLSYSSSSSPSSVPVIKFSSPGGHKTAIKFKSPPPIPQKSKPDFVFEKVTLPKYAEPILGTEAAIHQIAAPNLSLNQLDSDLTKLSVQAFSIEKPAVAQHHHHHYQVQENTNDLTVKNIFTGQKTLVAPDPDLNAYNTPTIHLSRDPLLNTPSDGQPKPSDVLYHQNIEFNASPLVQQHFVADPFSFPVTSQPQLQQYHLQQNAMVQQGMPLAALNPTYLVMQSNNLLGQHQQHLTPHLFSPANGYIDTSHSLQQPQQSYVSPSYGKNYEVASLGQIYSAQKDLYHQLQDVVTSTLSPSTASGFHYDISSLASQSQNVPAIAHLEPKPIVNNYQHAHNNFVDYPDEHLSPNDIHNFFAYDDVFRRQKENDLIIQEAHEKLKGKLELQKQQEAAAFDLHQLALGEKFNPLRFNPIVVPDDFQKRNDDSGEKGEDSYEEVDEMDSVDPTTTDKPPQEQVTA